jgi:phosphatidylethanolamine/phosphatidyl-N-methylethanolamine N-methyltransferase
MLAEPAEDASFVTPSPPFRRNPSVARRTPQSLLSKVMDEGRFLRQWAGNPLSVGAITPSGPELARTMARYLDPLRPGPVVELGPGTGVVTQAILERGIAPSNLTSIEYCSDFATLLRSRFPEVTIVQGDAYDLAGSLGDHPPLAGIVSSLPLFSRPGEARRALILSALERLAPGAPFIQFSYALVPPVREEHALFSLSKSGWIWNNMPPARVWVYRKREAPRIKA